MGGELQPVSESVPVCDNFLDSFAWNKWWYCAP